MDSVMKGLMGQCPPQNFWARTATGTATLTARVPYAVGVRGTWSRGRVEERIAILTNQRSGWRWVDEGKLIE